MNDELKQEILAIVHLCGCQSMNAPLAEVEELERATTEDLIKLFTSHLDERIEDAIWHRTIGEE